MIKLFKPEQKEIYSQLLDTVARNPTGNIFLNALMRFGKTAIGMKLASEKFKRVAVVIDQQYDGYLKLIPNTRFVLDETIFFLNQFQVEQIDNVDLVIVDDVDHVLQIKCNCPKLYMYGILNENFKKNIPEKNTIRYTYSDYLKAKNKPVLQKLKLSKTLKQAWEQIEELKLIPNHLVLVIGKKENTFDKLIKLNEFYTVLYSDDYYKIKNLVYQSQKPVILCTEKLVKNITIMQCQVVIIQEIQNCKDTQCDDVIQAAFRGMMNLEGKENTYVCFMNKKYEQTFIDYFKQEGIQF